MYFFFLIAHRFVSLWFFKNPFIVTSDTPRTLKSSRCILLYCSSQPSVPVSFINNPVEKKCPPAQKGWLALPSLFREIQNEWFHIFTILISLSVVPSLNTVTQPGKEKKNNKTKKLKSSSSGFLPDCLSPLTYTCWCNLSYRPETSHDWKLSRVLFVRFD